MHYLKKYLSGSAKDAVEGYFLVCTEDAYEEAKKLLDQRYGDPFVIANAFREKLDSWQKVPSRDGDALRKYSDFLRQCETAMQITGSFHVLNNPKENRKMLAKLPDWLITRWGRKASDWKENGKGFPPFKEFIQFMIRESNIACDPVVSIQALKGSPTGEKGTGDKGKAGVRKNGRAKQTSSTAFSTKVGVENSDKGEKSKSFKVKCFSAIKYIILTIAHYFKNGH